MIAYNVTPSPQPTCSCDLPMNTYIYINNVCVIVVNVLLAIFAVVCNAVVMLAVFKTNSLRRPSNLLICSLALSDFLVGAVAQPLVVVRTLLHNAGADCCLYNHVHYISNFTFYLFACGSFATVCIMSWDRYKAVSSPLQYRSIVTNKKITRIIAAVWSAWVIYVIIVVNLPILDPPLRTPVVLLMLATFIIIPLVSQIVIQKLWRRHTNQIAAAIPSVATLAREKKMLVTFRYILAAICGSILPPLLLVVVTRLSGENNTLKTYPPPWVKTMLCLSSCLNPVIYFMRHSDMRSAALRLIGRG